MKRYITNIITETIIAAIIMAISYAIAFLIFEEVFTEAVFIEKTFLAIIVAGLMSTAGRILSAIIWPPIAIGFLFIYDRYKR